MCLVLGLETIVSFLYVALRMPAEKWRSCRWSFHSGAFGLSVWNEYGDRGSLRSDALAPDAVAHPHYGLGA